MVGEAVWVKNLAEKVKTRRRRADQIVVEVRQLLQKTRRTTKPGSSRCSKNTLRL